MRVSRCVEKAFEQAAIGDLEAAMLFACLAVDGSAAIRFPELRRQNKKRFTDFLREHYDVLQPTGAPQIDLLNSRFARHPRLTRPSSGEYPDVADILYQAHRCSHAHGDDVPEDFELVAPSDVGSLVFEIGTITDNGRLRLPATMLWGLLAVTVLAPSNASLEVAGDWQLTWTPGLEEPPAEPALVMPVNEWWGRKADLLQVVGRFPRSYVTVRVDLDEWPVTVEPGAAHIQIEAHSAN